MNTHHSHRKIQTERKKNMKKNRLILTISAALILLLCIPSSVFAAEGDTGTTVDGFAWVELADGTAAVTGYSGAATSVTVPVAIGAMTVSKIDHETFIGNTSITAVTIPASVEYIDFAAFKNCTNLAAVTFTPTSSLITIGESCFENCDALTAVVLPASLQGIVDYAFYGCDHLSSVTLPSGLQEISEGAFKNCIALTSVTVPGSVSIIGVGAFSGCTALATVTLNEGVSQLNGESFRNCSALQSIAIPNSMTQISFLSFAGCTHLSNVSISAQDASLETIGENSFNNCDALTEITLPKSLLGLVQEAFSGCDNLKKATIYSKTTDLSNPNIFGTSTSAPLTATGTTHLTDIYGYSASTAQTYASDNSITFHPLSVTSSDTTSGITVSGGIPEGTVVHAIQVISSSEIYKKALQNTGTNKMLLLFDISLLLEEEKIQPTGDVSVTIAIPEEYRGLDHLAVAYIDDNGNITFINSTVQNGTITFVTNHFSSYALMQEISATGATSPATGDVGLYLICIVLCIGALGGIVVVMKKKSALRK